MIPEANPIRTRLTQGSSRIFPNSKSTGRHRQLLPTRMHLSRTLETFAQELQVLLQDRLYLLRLHPPATPTLPRHHLPRSPATPRSRLIRHRRLINGGLCRAFRHRRPCPGDGLSQTQGAQCVATRYHISLFPNLGHRLFHGLPLIALQCRYHLSLHLRQGLCHHRHKAHRLRRRRPRRALPVPCLSPLFRGQWDSPTSREVRAQRKPRSTRQRTLSRDPVRNR